MTCLWSLVFPNMKKMVELVVGVVLLEVCVKGVAINYEMELILHDRWRCDLDIMI